MVFQRFHVGFRISAKNNILFSNDTDAHGSVHLQGFCNDVAAVQPMVDDADFTFSVGHIFDNLSSLGFPNNKIVLIRIVLLNQVHKGIHRKGIVLAGNGEFRTPSFAVSEVFLHILCLFQQHSGKGQQFFPLTSYGYPLYWIG